MSSVSVLLTASFKLSLSFLSLLTSAMGEAPPHMVRAPSRSRTLCCKTDSEEVSKHNGSCHLNLASFSGLLGLAIIHEAEKQLKYTIFIANQVLYPGSFSWREKMILDTRLNPVT